jgi:hypothetical protein
VSYLVGYLVNFMLLWRVFAACGVAERLGSAVVPMTLVVLSSVALSQHPKTRRTLLREIDDYESKDGAQALLGR